MNNIPSRDKIQKSINIVFSQNAQQNDKEKWMTLGMNQSIRRLGSFLNNK